MEGNPQNFHDKGIYPFLVSVVVPIFNERENLFKLIPLLENELTIYSNYEIILVDDGSTDDSLEIIKDKSDKNGQIKYISFSRNFGHQFALKAGLDNAQGDCVISMDGDLQHPPQLIHDMINLWLKGNDIVYTIRQDDTNINIFKKYTASIFYFITNKISDVKTVKGAADFRLIDKKVIQVLASFNEAHLFLRSIIPWIGFKQASIYYKPNHRFAGTSKYTIVKMIKFALNGITSFSIKPLQISIILGYIISSISFFYGVYAILASVVNHSTVSGWTSLIVCILFIGGIQLIILGIIGEYIGRIFIQVKNRPTYIIKESSIKK
jgi:polyisoprenyl-phosphate glycosyltransferase